MALGPPVERAPRTKTAWSEANRAEPLPAATWGAKPAATSATRTAPRTPVQEMRPALNPNLNERQFSQESEKKPGRLKRLARGVKSFGEGIGEVMKAFDEPGPGTPGRTVDWKPPDWDIGAYNQRLKEQSKSGEVSWMPPY